MRDAQGRGGRRGRSSGRGRGSTRHNNKSNEIFKEYKLAEERFVEKLYKAKFGVWPWPQHEQPYPTITPIAARNVGKQPRIER